MRRSRRLRFTLLAVAALVPPLAVSIAGASYCAAIFEIGAAEFKAIKGVCFFAVLLAEAFVYVKHPRWGPLRPRRDEPPPAQPAP
jgi:hypothetical protein